MATVTLADDWIHSVLSLATSPTPRGRVILMIVMFHHIIYRLCHQSDPGWKEKKTQTVLKKKITLLLIWIQFPHSLCDESHFWEIIMLTLQHDLSKKYMNNSWRETQRSRQGANGVNVSPRWPDERSSIVCCRVKASALIKSPSVALSGRQIRIQHQTHKYWLANRL